MVLKKYLIFLFVLVIGFTSGVSTGFYIYSVKFPQNLVKIETVKLKRSPGASQSVDIIQSVERDTLTRADKRLLRKALRKLKRTEK